MKTIDRLKSKVRYDSILTIPITQELRYFRFAEFIKNLLKEKKGLKILEVSSGASGITKFVKTPVIGMDIRFIDLPSPFLKQLRHSALKKFPFKDNEFDAVLSVDGYEHLPKKKRKKTLLEMYRVTNKHLLITTLFNETKYDRKILREWGPENKYYNDIYEHKKMGFPSLNEIRQYLHGKKYKIKIMKGAHPRLAYFLKKSEQNIISSMLSRTVLRIFMPILKRITGTKRNHHRYHLFIEKLK